MPPGARYCPKGGDPAPRMHGLAFLQDLAVVMIAAAVAAVVFRRLRQPVVLGYILAGVLVGPHTPPSGLIHDQASINTLSELGIVFLMFSLGLEFNLRRLRETGAAALLAATLEILLMLAAGYRIGRWFGWDAMDSLFLGAMLSISSTTIIVKALGELRMAKEPFARLVFGILVIEDLLAIVMLALLSGIAVTGSLGVADAGAAIGKLGAFLAASVVAGLIAVPRAIASVGRLKSDELLLVSILGLCFGMSLLAAKLGYSVALGAFLAGAMASESRELGRIEHLVAPVRDLFGAVFFVSIGLLIDPAVLARHAIPIAVLTATVIVGKVAACSLGTFVAGRDTRTALRVGMSLAQIGEFSFVIAALGLSLKVTSDFLYPIAVAVSALTTLATPHLIRSSDALVRAVERAAPRGVAANLALYTRWVGSLRGPASPDRASGFIRRWLLQVALNCVLVAAIFLAAAWAGDRGANWWPESLRALAGHRTVLWAAAVVVSLPLFIASFRKLQALGLLLAETRVSRGAAGDRTDAIRTVVAHTVPSVGLVGLAVFGLVASSMFLPGPRELALGLVVALLLGGLLWRQSIRVYSRAQVALGETLASGGHAHDAAAASPAALPAMLRESNLRPCVIPAAGGGARRLIRELALRTRTGATLVAIERAGAEPVLNPGPDEELLPGDHVLLLGSEPQIHAAMALLEGPAGAKG